MTDRNDKTTVLPQYSFDITLREGGKDYPVLCTRIESRWADCA